MTKKTALALVLALVAGAAGFQSLRSSGTSGAPQTAAAAANVTSAASKEVQGEGRSAVVAGARDLHLGAQFTYEVKAERVYTNGAGKALMSTVDGGRLVLTVVGQKDGGAAVRAVLQDSVQPGLGEPFFFVLAEDGRVTSYGFAKSYPAEARNRLRALVSSLQVAPKSVERSEGDVSGEATASYVRQGDDVVRTKVRYDRVRTPAGLVSPGEIGGSYEVVSKAVFALDASGWPASLTEQEAISAVFQAGKMTTTAKTTAKLLAKGEDKSLAGTYEAAQSGFDPDVEAIGEAAKLASENADKSLVNGATFADLQKELEGGKDQRGRNKAVARMSALFRTNPEAIGEARAKLLAKGTPEATGRALAGALGAARSPEAQRALADALASSDVPGTVKNASAISLGLTEQPTAEAKGALTTASKSSDGELASTATLALGNLAKSGGDSAADVVTDLLARLEAATTPEDKAILLDALGNSGSPRALDAILARTTDTAAVVRAAAYGALKLERDERVVKTLPVGMFDAIGTVRRAAIDAVGQQDLAPFVDALQLVLQKSEDAEDRLAAVRVLARGVNAVPAAEAALSWAATNDKDAKVRDAATTALSKPKR